MVTTYEKLVMFCTIRLTKRKVLTHFHLVWGKFLIKKSPWKVLEFLVWKSAQTLCLNLVQHCLGLHIDKVVWHSKFCRYRKCTWKTLLYIICITITILSISQLHTLWQIFAHLCPQLNCFPQVFPHDTSVTWHGMLWRTWKIWN